MISGGAIVDIVPPFLFLKKKDKQKTDFSSEKNRIRSGQNSSPPRTKPQSFPNKLASFQGKDPDPLLTQSKFGEVIALAITGKPQLLPRERLDLKMPFGRIPVCQGQKITHALIIESQFQIQRMLVIHYLVAVAHLIRVAGPVIYLILEKGGLEIIPNRIHRCHDAIFFHLFQQPLAFQLPLRLIARGQQEQRHQQNHYSNHILHISD